MKVLSEKNGIVVLAANGHTLAGVWASETSPDTGQRYALELDIAPSFTWGVDLHAAETPTCQTRYNGMANQFQGAVLSNNRDGVLGVDTGAALALLEVRNLPAGLEYVAFSVAPEHVRIFPVIL